MNRKTWAIELAKAGFYVFPLRPNSKLPAISKWQTEATRDTDQISTWWQQDFNIGIFTGRFGDSQALCVVDVDCKKGKDGNASILELEFEGCEFPTTLEQSTPATGRHIIYAVDEPLKQGVNVLGEGLDIRSRGGYIVGPGSVLDGKEYAITRRIRPAPAPAWLVDRLGRSPDPVVSDYPDLGDVDPDRAVGRAVEYLKTAPIAVEGEGGDLTTFKVAAKLKDLGCDEAMAVSLLGDWNAKCQPPWSLDELAQKVQHAYRYGKEQPGSAAPEAVFTAQEQEVAEEGNHPFDVMNREYAYIKKGAFILQETTDHKGVFKTEHLSQDELHGWFANKTIQVGERRVAASRLWVADPGRREFEAVVFAPEQDRGPRWYNLWRGFTVEPAATGGHPAVDAFKEHALRNICGGDKALCHWLLGFFAHIIQRPWEKPLVALVFKGKKGTGKNALVERVGALFKPHFFVADDERYLTSNFNAHLESCLFLVLDEAAWAGDKRAEGRLKGLITGADHNIERKGKEAYKVDNLTRVAIIGNEKWLVPATQDERRFAVFNVGEGRKQDRKFFHDMRTGMENGGYAHLLRFLMDYDISGVDVSAAPSTSGLVDQKHASLESVHEWWLDCLMSDQLVGSDWEGELPPMVPTNRMRQAFESWARSRNIRSRLPGRKDFVKDLLEVAPSMPKVKARPEDESDATYAWKNPGIATLRSDWEKYIGGPVNWDDQ